MKFLGVLLAIFAVICVRADKEQCTEERAETCIENLLSAVLEDDSSEEDICRELQTSVDCLKEAVDECLGDERDPELEEGFEELEKLLSQCDEEYDKTGNEKDDEMEKCYEENEDYIMNCVSEGNQDALTLLMEKGGDLDENVLKCTMYGLMTGCFVDRVREKCGERAAAAAELELNDVPAEIEEACKSMGDIEPSIVEGIHLIGDKKRK